MRFMTSEWIFNSVDPNTNRSNDISSLYLKKANNLYQIEDNLHNNFGNILGSCWGTLRKFVLSGIYIMRKDNKFKGRQAECLPE